MKKIQNTKVLVALFDFVFYFNSILNLFFEMIEIVRERVKFYIYLCLDNHLSSFISPS